MDSPLESEGHLQAELIEVWYLAAEAIVVLNLQGREITPVIAHAKRGAMLKAGVGDDGFGGRSVDILVAEIGPVLLPLVRHLGIKTRRIETSAAIVKCMADEHRFIQPFKIRRDVDGVDGRNVLLNAREQLR